LGQFNLPVTITPTSNKIFFIDPTNGDDASEGTAAEPWKFVQNVLKSDESTGLKVLATAIAGNDVVVTILGGGTENVAAQINTQPLFAGSVTVLQAPFPKTFTLNMGGNKLILKKGYKLQDINIISSATGTAVEIAHPTAGLASVEVECTASSVICVEVEGAGSHTLKDVTVKVEAKSGNVGIKNNTGANLSIVGGEVRLIEPTSSPAAITLINAQGVLTATGLTVDMTGGGHAKASTGILLNKAGSLVTGSTIKVNQASSSNAIGIKVQHTMGKSTVEGNIFIGPTASNPNAIGINGASKLSSNASAKNTFLGNFTNTVVP
jgi:hypothetical protein